MEYQVLEVVWPDTASHQQFIKMPCYCEEIQIFWRCQICRLN